MATGSPWSAGTSRAGGANVARTSTDPSSWAQTVVDAEGTRMARSSASGEPGCASWATTRPIRRAPGTSRTAAWWPTLIASVNPARAAYVEMVTAAVSGASTEGLDGLIA